MKRSIILSLICVTVLLASCTKEAPVVVKLIEYQIDGEWTLRSVVCMCEPVNLEPGEQVWSIVANDGVLHVDNNVEEDLHTIFETGDYEIQVDSENEKLFINGNEWDYEFQDGNLIVSDNPEVDGPTIFFEPLNQ